LPAVKIKMNDFKVGDLVCWEWEKDSLAKRRHPIGIVINKFYLGGYDYVNIFWIDYKYVLPERILNPRLKKLK